MPLYALGDLKPQLLGGGHFIAPNASLVGNVKLHAGASVWFNAVLRAEHEVIEVGEGSNIQDGAVLHVDPGFALSIGRNVTVGHQAMLHGCAIADGVLIGINAVVLNGADVGEGALIGANALVTENMVVPPHSLVLGSPAKIVKRLSEPQRVALSAGANNYRRKSEQYNEALMLLDAQDCIVDE